MKLTKKILAFVLVAAMLVTPWSSAMATTSTSFSYVDSYSVVDGVNYEGYNVKGASSGHTEAVSVLEFHPDDGYIPMAFAASAGNCNLLSSQYSTAVNKYGYEVAGIINGSFFDLETSTMEGMLISGGKVACADIGYTYGNLLDVVAFGYDGSMSIIESQLAYYMYINGTLVPDALRFINKKQSSDGWRTDAIYYYDTSCGSKADSSTYGYEVVCKKQNGTDLVVGDTMVAEVIQINGYTSGSTIDNDSSIESDNFVLSTPSGSSYISYLTGLQVGDTVEISIEETVAESKEIMENASSVITNVGCLVKDGVDLTDSYSTIGTHSVYTNARWTAFGTKDDGTYVFFTSEGGDTGTTSRSLNLKDVASAMINLGCTDVIRMDGGGSTAMYVSNTGSGSPGYKMSHSRSVADCIMVVKKTSDMKLKEAIEAAEKISHKDYTAAELVAIRAAYETAKEVYYGENSTDADYATAANTLNALIEKDAVSAPEITDGDPFWLTHYNDVNAEGAGSVMTSSYSGGAWYLHVAFSPVAGTAAYEITAISDGTNDGSATALAIPDGGFVYTINKGNDWPTIYAANPDAYSWAANLPDYTSDACTAAFNEALTWEIGDQFIFNGLDLTGKTVPTTTSSVNWYDDSYVCTAVMAPYVPEEGGTEDSNVSDGIYVTGFNTPITAGSSVIYTSEFNGGWISTTAANHNWSYNIICTWDETVGAYVVTQASQGTGDDTPTYQLLENMIMIAVHNDETTADSIANFGLAANAQVGQVLNTYGVDIDARYLSVAPYVTLTSQEGEDPDVPVDPDPDEPIVPDEPENVIEAMGEGAIKAQKNNNTSDIRLIAYVDKLEAYSKVSFTLTIGDRVSMPLECTTAYSTLYTNTTPVTTQDIYNGKDGYFVTYTVRSFFDNITPGQEVTFTVTYTKVTGETFTCERTIQFGTAEEPDEPVLEPVTVTGNLTYANGWDWSDSYCYQKQIFVYASASETATPASMHGQGTGFLGWQNGIVFEYNDENATWEVVECDFTADGVNAAESATLGSNRFAVIFHNEATVGQADAYNFFTNYAKEGAEFTLNTDIATLQSASGALSNVTLSYTYYVEVENPDEGGTTDPDEGGTTTPVDPSGITAGQITSINYYQWPDSAPQANHIYGYASNTSAQTPYSMNGNYTLFKTGYGLVLQYNSSTGKYKVISVDYDTTDGTNSAEFQELSDGILVVLFSEEAATSQADAYNFLKNNVVEGAEFYLSTELEYIQYGNGATGSVSNLYLSLLPIEEEDNTTEPEDPVVGTVSSYGDEYTSQGYNTASSGDTDGLSAVLYAPNSGTYSATGISTHLNLGAVDTILYTSEDALAKQKLGIGIASDKTVDNAYLYLCMNSNYWSGDFGLVKRLGDADWEIVCSEYYNYSWYWNAYATGQRDVNAYYNSDYVYWKYNVMDGTKALYIKDSEYVKDLQMELISSGNTVTFAMYIDGTKIFSMSDSVTLSSLKFGRAASMTNSGESVGSSNYLDLISSTANGRTPAELTNVQFYNTYYYYSGGNDKLTCDNGYLWIYPSNSSNAGRVTNAEGNPIVTYQEVTLSDGTFMDIIDIENY